ncbi:low affinity immunoglobulin gamma Fc region receptor II-like isoform X2 [Oreochromis aureus]|uniref:low affinity immunoglobulin gamma Fc region receptor II-like isoform X2 n=1 Tax=Oreochromis aureus TaxID=47969 RepID=UPI001953276C|nr:low affinity immunoglobulin gamma Fc region receptor II-like isoform X2 [Oreochromis aureus]
MVFRAACIKLLITVKILLCAHDDNVGAVFLHVVPNRSQFFEYEPVTFYCEGVSHYNVVHKLRGKIKSCSNTNEKTATGLSCSIKNLYTDESGEFICETEGGEKSNIINFTVTAGSVILESPAVPVMEGEAVTLSCRNKTTSSSFTAEFYKDGQHIRNSSTGYMTIGRVSKSDEGHYKCSISGAGESPVSWLNVTGQNTGADPDIPQKESPAATPWIIVAVLLSVVLVVGALRHFGKDYWDRALLYLSTKVRTSDSTERQAEASAPNASKATYATVNKNRKKTGGGENMSFLDLCFK